MSPISKIPPRVAAVVVIVASLCLLMPGITQPLMTIKAAMNHQTLIREGKLLISEQSLHPALTTMATQFLENLKVHGESVVYEKSRSLLGTAQDLWQNGYPLVAVLIVLFSTVVPTIKLLLMTTFTLRGQGIKTLATNALIGKWSMADVFAMALLIALLAANTSDPKGAMIQFEAIMHSGFYWFIAYCIVSGMGGQLLVHLHQAEAVTLASRPSDDPAHPPKS